MHLVHGSNSFMAWPLVRSTNRRVLPAVALAVLAFAAGCGNGSSNQPSGKGFTNASLQGNYTYTLSGSYLNSPSGNDPFEEAGTFIADGQGNISGGVDDFVQDSVLSTGQLTGSYKIGDDGTGTITLNLARGAVQFAITLLSGSSLYLIEYDTFANGDGVALQQTPSAFSVTPSGTFIFRLKSSLANSTALGAVSSVGEMTLQSGSISGTEDVIRAGMPGSLTITGSMTAPSDNGRGTVALTDAGGNQSSYVYYVVDSNTLKFLETDPGPMGGGRADAQSGGPFSNASLKNGFSFRGRGDTVTQAFGANSIGAFVSDGNGNIVNGSYDAVQDGTPISNVPLTGTYNVDSQGRATITLNPQGLNPIPLIVWMVNSSYGLLLVNTPDVAEVGRLDQQQNEPFSAASLNGQFAFYTFGYGQNVPSTNRVGVMTFDGNATVTFTNFFANKGGSTRQNGSASGNYVVSANGRVVAFSIGAVNTQIIYLISGNSGSLILDSSGWQMAGSVGQQTPP